jgi:hypothetical protein
MEGCIPIKTENKENTHAGYTFLFLNMGEDSKALYPKKYIYKTYYANQNFIVDDSFDYYKYTDTLNLRNVAHYGLYPIPYFEYFDFGLGSLRFDFRSSGVPAIIDKYNVPDDLEVFVIKAGHVYFWKLKFEQERPESLGVWKNGYSSGIAISEKLNMIVYWMKAW